MQFPEYFLRTKPKGNPKAQPCQPEENPVLPNSFTWIYILFYISFLTIQISNSKRSRNFFCKANLGHF